MGDFLLVLSSSTEVGQAPAPTQAWMSALKQILTMFVT